MQTYLDELVRSGEAGVPEWGQVRHCKNYEATRTNGSDNVANDCSHLVSRFDAKYMLRMSEYIDPKSE